MKMNELMEIQNKIQKKSSRWRYKFAAVFLLLIIAALLYAAFTQEQKSDPVCDKLIREAVSLQLHKEPNDLTDEDFAKITKLSIKGKELSDIRLLEKFTNLQQLELIAIDYPKNAIPQWISIMAKFCLFNLKNRFSINLSPLENLHNLKMLTINFTTISNNECLSNLVNLQWLDLNGTSVSDLKPFKNLTYLHCLNINSSQIFDLEPIMGFKNLRTLYIQDCPNITERKVEELQKALPNLKIER